MNDNRPALYRVDESGFLIPNFSIIEPEYVAYIMEKAAQDRVWPSRWPELEGQMIHPDLPSLSELRGIFNADPVAARKLILLASVVYPVVVDDLHVLQHVDDVDWDDEMITIESLEEYIMRRENSRYSEDFKQPETAGEFFARMKREEQSRIQKQAALKAIAQQERMRFAALNIGIGMGLASIVAILMFILLQ